MLKRELTTFNSRTNHSLDVTCNLKNAPTEIINKKNNLRYEYDWEFTSSDGN